MSKKIILFLSDLKKGEAMEYRCPGGGTVSGVQTCEAPLRYLLGTFPPVSEVLCIVTPVGRKTVSAVEQIVKAASPATAVTEIPFADGEDFSSGPLTRIMGEVARGDEILLELTGGLRDAVMQLLLTSRALSFSGIPTAGAVYSNFGTREIVDCFDLIGLFDLLGGMQELASFGSVKALRDYYARRSGRSPEITALLDAMEKLHEDITLCRTGKIDQRIAAFNKAVDGAENCSDRLMAALIPAFRAKFGRKLNVPSLIRWCINSDMLQQALTLYRERIPGYLLERSILSVKEHAGPPGEKAQWETEEDVRFRTQLLTLAMLKDTRRCFPNSDYIMGKNVTCSKLQTILQDYEYIRQLRNMVNHAGDGNDLEQNDKMKCLCESTRYKSLDQVRAADIRRALERGLEHLKSC